MTLQRILLGVTLVACSIGKSQAQGDLGVKGFRMPRSGTVWMIYPSTAAGDVEPKHGRILDHTVLFTKLELQRTVGSDTYSAIIIPDLKGSKEILSLSEAAKHLGRASELAGTKIDAGDLGTRYWMLTTELEKAIQVHEFKLVRGPSFGALMLPIVLRPQRGDLPFTGQGQLSINGAVGVSFSLSEDGLNSLVPVGFLGLQSLNFTASNNTGITDPEASISGSGIGYGGGLIADFNGKQVGLFLGADKGFGDLGETYVYQDALWIGIGIGVRLFTPEGKRDLVNN